MKNFSIYAGASEPAAYAVCALRELARDNNIPRPTEREPIYFAVFDFGGGTTDFDFGLWRLPTATDKRGFNDVIEHFDADSDSGLGGEKLLNLIAYEVYKNNLPTMRENAILFSLPEGCKPFDGAEFLISDSLIANLNRRRLSDKLRPIWEEWYDFESMDDEPLISRGDNDGTWKKFLYVTENKFDIFFTSEPRAVDGKIPIDQTERISCRVNREGRIFIRKTSPNEIEYIVAEDADSPKNFLSKIAKVELSN